MRITARFTTAALALALSLAAGPAAVAAQELPDGVTAAELDRALDAHHEDVERDRQAVERVLATPEARRITKKLGVDRDRLGDAVHLLEGERLAYAADQARLAESQLAGGQAISLNATALIIVLILVVIVILIAD